MQDRIAGAGIASGPRGALAAEDEGMIEATSVTMSPRFSEPGVLEPVISIQGPAGRGLGDVGMACNRVDQVGIVHRKGSIR